MANKFNKEKKFGLSQISYSTFRVLPYYIRKIQPQTGCTRLFICEL